MTAAAKKAKEGGDTAFNPSTGEVLEVDEVEGWSGQRRVFVRQPSSLLWELPVARKQRFDAFDAWQAMAAQVLHDVRASFQVIAAFKILFNWKTGDITATDARFTRYCGGCSAKTVSRIVGIYEDLGIIKIEHGWRVVADHRRIRTRTIRLAVPESLPPVTIIPDDDSDTDHCGPDGGGN